MDNNKRTIQLMNKFFKKGTYKGEKGWYGYKLFETVHHSYMYPMPKHWDLTKGNVLTLPGKERLDKNIKRECARGIHFATEDWVKRFMCIENYPLTCVFKVFVSRSNVDNIIVGEVFKVGSTPDVVKVRTDRLTLVHQVDMNT